MAKSPWMRKTLLVCLLFMLLVCNVMPLSTDIKFRKAQISDLPSVAKLCTESLETGATNTAQQDNLQVDVSSSSLPFLKELTDTVFGKGNNRLDPTERLEFVIKNRMVNLVDKGAKHLMLVAVDQYGSNENKMSGNQQPNDLQGNLQQQKVVGFAEMGMMPLPISDSSDSTAKEYPYLANVAVAEGYRRQGLGSKLVKLAFKIATDKWEDDALFLSVETDNERAVQMYSKLRFDLLLDAGSVPNNERASSSSFPGLKLGGGSSARRSRPPRMYFIKRR